jgi:proton-dependent oligopeptide transporter, POT family
MSNAPEPEAKNDAKPWYAEITQPFKDLVRAPRALWGVNVGYTIEGMCYFGILGYLTIYFSEFVFRGSSSPDEIAHAFGVAPLTWGITLSMFFLGTVADKKGVRFAMLGAFVLLLIGRVVMSAAPTVFGLQPGGMWSPLYLVTMGGILLVVIGYGMYMPAAYTAVKQFSNPRTAGMGYAMLYALMNLGGWFPTFAFLLRDDDYAGLGIPGMFWVYTGFTVISLVVTAVLLTRSTVENAIARGKKETAEIEALDAGKNEKVNAERKEQAAKAEAARRMAPIQMWLLVLGILVAVWFRADAPLRYYIIGASAAAWLALNAVPSTARWLARHPLADLKFFFFIFALIPVQTLFTYNWLVLPPYIERAYEGWIGKYFEVLSNANPLLIFILCPMVAAITQKAKVYNMMIFGTFVMAAPAFLLVIGPHPWTLVPFIVLMSVGEAMWQPRFLQYAAEIAPEGRTGEYMGVAQFPWFLTKMLVPMLYSGWMMGKYCPAQGPKNTELMWLIFGCIAMASTVLLVLAKGWIGKDFKTSAKDA